MPHIMEMPPHVADLIAAGEVVERPASVVKELVENAVDAGATAVSVELRRGGMGMIRVSDNGCGIAPEELPTAFLRHATSKLRQAGDLGNIRTLGFRGEALAAIASVSRVEICTRQRGADSAASLRLEGGAPGGVEAAGAPEGTTITVSDLFYNTPARLKFMKKDSAETAAVAGLMQHLALSRPEISFRFTKDGAESLHTPGDGKQDSAVYAALGRDFARTLLAVEGRGGETEVRGFVTQPESGRGSRSMQVFFVNGRFIKSQLLTAALEEGYRNQLMKGKFPGCVLYVTVPAAEVDVNVHPAKTVVKFSREKEVFDAVYHTVLDGLAARGGVVAAGEAAGKSVTPRRDFYQTMDAKAFRERQGGGGGQAARPGSSCRAAPADRTWEAEEPGASSRRESAGQGRRGDFVSQELAPYNREIPPEAPALRSVTETVPDPPSGGQRPFVPAIPSARAFRRVLESPVQAARTEGEAAAAPETEAGARPREVPDAPEPREAGRAPSEEAAPEQQTIQPQGEPPWRIAGEVFRTYIVCESADGCLWLIDKHAAHERINFDRLKNGAEPVMAQTLLTPLAVELGREDAALLLGNLPLLERFGFACEDFGDGTVLVREVPSDIDAGDAASTLEEFAENLRRGRSLDERRENLLHTMACKAAIKGGWDSDRAELEALVGKVQSGQVRYCPHGRPVAVKLTKHELEKMFGRA